MATPEWDIKFEALRNAIYHSSRRRFFELLIRFLSFLVIVSGTLAVATLANWDPRWPAAGAAVIGAMQLVFDFNGRARLHENLQRRYFELIAKIEQVLTPTEQEIASWKSDLNLMYADEPPPMRALDTVAYNKACDSLGCPEGRRRLTLWQWFMQHIYSFPNTEFAPRINDSTGRSGLYSNGSTTRGTLVVWMTSTGHLPLGAQAFESLTSHSFLLPFPPPSSVRDCRACSSRAVAFSAGGDG